VGTTDGIIIATIIVDHMPRNDAAASTHVCPAMRIQAIDIVQLPGISMPGGADIDRAETTVAPVLAMKRTAEVPRNHRSDRLRTEPPGLAQTSMSTLPCISQ
jgi:hypothetical protein